jgi:hypothetical protein
MLRHSDHLFVLIVTRQFVAAKSAWCSVQGSMQHGAAWRLETNSMVWHLKTNFLVGSVMG